jgi:hypothetical protein
VEVKAQREAHALQRTRKELVEMDLIIVAQVSVCLSAL